MADNRSELVTLVHNRDTLSEDEQVEYFKQIIELIDNTFYFEMVYKSPAFNSGVIAIDDFRNLCWEMLEGGDDDQKGRLIDKLSYKEFSDDRQLKKFLRITFENLGKDALSRHKPEFQTRKKQMNRVLNEIGIKKPASETGLKSDLWVLNEIEGEKTLILDDLEIPSMDKIKGCMVKIPLPEMKYPSSQTSKRGGSIKDNDMKRYLTALLHAAGGCINTRDINPMITEMFGLTGLDLLSIDNSEEGESDDAFDGKKGLKKLEEKRLQEPIYNAHHFMAAEHCLEVMPLALQDIIHYIYNEGLNQGDTATQLGVSASTLTNRMNQLKHFIRGKLEEEDDSMQCEDGIIVFEVIKALICKKRQVEYEIKG